MSNTSRRTSTLQGGEYVRSAAFMNTIRWQLVRLLNCSHTYGYITKHNRTRLNLEKSHVNDAFVVAGGTDQERARPYQGRQTRRNNRALQTNRNGFKPSIRTRKYSFQPNDIVYLRIKSLICIVKGVFSYGKWIRVIDSIGNIINQAVPKLNSNCTNQYNLSQL